MVVPNCEYGDKRNLHLRRFRPEPEPDIRKNWQLSQVLLPESFKLLVQEEPVVAMLSHSTKGSAKHADVDKVVEATRIAKESYPDLKLDGEFQLDAAIVPSVGASQGSGQLRSR